MHLGRIFSGGSSVAVYGKSNDSVPVQAKAEVDKLNQLELDRSTLAFGSAMVRSPPASLLSELHFCGNMHPQSSTPFEVALHLHVAASSNP